MRESKTVLFLLLFLLAPLVLPIGVYSKEKKITYSVKKSSQGDFLIIDLRQYRGASSSDKSAQDISSSEGISIIDLTREKHEPLSRQPWAKVILMEADPLLFQREGVCAAPTSGGSSEYLQMIAEISKRFNIDPQLVQIMIGIESGFNPNAVSPQNAQGLMQIMPETAKGLNLTDPFDPYSNIEAGVRYLRLQLDRFGCLELALAAYNAGPGAVEKYGGIPPYEETENYVKTILNRYYNGE